MFEELRRHGPETIAKARGDLPVDLLLRDARLFVPTTREWIVTDLAISDGAVVGFGRREAHETRDLDGAFVTPGFIDAHMHIESTKLWVTSFVAAVLPWGTTAIANDPHEVANVIGPEGVAAMIAATRALPFTFGFSASSCVPASRFESPGAAFELADVVRVLDSDLGIGLAEVMNYPGVIAGDPDMLAKIRAAGTKRVDGHAPALTGRNLDAYLVAGPESDHEMLTLEEVEEKRRKGMWVFLREGSASQNLATLAPTVLRHGTTRVAFASDDREPDLISQRGHINHCIEVAREAGIALEDALVMATLNPAEYHGFRHLGLLAPGYQADLNVFGSLTELRPDLVYQRGRLVAERGRLVADLPTVPAPAFMRDRVRLQRPLESSDFDPGLAPGDEVRVIVVRDRLLATGNARARWSPEDPSLNHLAVVERHHATGRIGRALLRDFGLRRGAIASTVAHDAHNLMVVGANSGAGLRDMAVAANRVAALGGGQVACLDGTILGEVALPIAGLMSDLRVEELGPIVAKLHRLTHVELGCPLTSAFMTLSFLGLSVIPQLKLTDKGLVDVDAFTLVPLRA